MRPHRPLTFYQPLDSYVYIFAVFNLGKCLEVKDIVKCSGWLEIYPPSDKIRLS